MQQRAPASPAGAGHRHRSAAHPVPVVSRRAGWYGRPVLALATVWLAFVGAQRVLSGRAWWWNLPDLVPPLIFAAVPVLLLALAAPARRFRRPVAALAVTSLALGWSMAGLNPGTLWHRPPPAPPGAVTIFAWNTWYWDESVRWGPDGQRLYDPDGFYRHLRDQAADVYLLQEYLYLDDDMKPLPVLELDRIRRHFPGFHVAVSGELVTLSRFPVVLERPIGLRPWLSRQWDDLPPPDSPLPDYYTVKTLRTDVTIAGRVVSFYNSHIHVPLVGSPTRRAGTADDPRARHDLRLADYRALAADVEANPHPVVLAGDLNSTSTMRLLRDLPDRLRDATAALDSLYPTSWARFGLPLWRLDWMFHSADVTVHRYRMVPSGDQSDHSGQRVVISY